MGGLVGYQQLSLSVLTHKMGAGTRLVGVVAAAMCALTLFAGAAFLSLFPKVVLGGLLLYLGLTFLKEWVVDAWSRLPRVEYAIVLFILLVIATVGFLEGVIVGVVAAIILFVIAYSRIDVVRHELTGEHVESRVVRSPAERQYLRREGQRIHVLRLQGFIFFGTADRLLRLVRSRIDRADLLALRAVVFDFRRVTGLDTTGLLSFAKLRQVAASRDVSLVMTDMAPSVRAQLERGGLRPDARLRYFRDLDQGMEWCEGELLRRSGEQASPAPTMLRQQLSAILPDADSLQAVFSYLVRLDFESGARLIGQGEASDSLYFVESGRVTAQLEYPDRPSVRLETMGSGRVVGEIGFYLDLVRTASVVVDAPSVVYRLTRDALARMERERPDAASALHRLIVKLLAERAIHLTASVDALQQ